MDSRHLAAELLSRYATGETQPEETRLIEAHLSDCTYCRRQVSELGQLEGLLQQQYPATDATPVDHVFSEARALAIQSRHAQHTDTPKARPGNTGAPWSTGSALSLAAALLAVAGLQWSRPPAVDEEPIQPISRSLSPERLSPKGVNTPPLRGDEVSLSFSVRVGTNPLELGRRQGHYPPEARLFFRAHLQMPGYLALVRVANDGVEWLAPRSGHAPPIATVTPQWDLADQQHLLAYSLEGLQGQQDFMVLFSPESFRPSDDIIAHALSGDLDIETMHDHNLVMDALSITVIDP